MTDMYQEIDDLSDEQRELLELLLEEQAIESPDASLELLLQSLDRRAPATQEQKYPLSSSQRRLWFLDQVDPGSSLYNIPSAFRLVGSIDHALLTRCLQTLVGRHQSLRTTFPVVDGEPIQKIHPEMEIPIEFVDLQSDRDQTTEQREQRALQLAREQARQPFDLARGPLLRFVLYQIEPDLHIGLLTMHHIISDGWSMGVLIRELVALYQSYSQGLLPDLPEIRYQYVDYSIWQNRWMRSKKKAVELDYWKARLSGDLPVLQLPSDRPRPAAATHRGSSLTFSISAEILQAANVLANQESATLFMVLLSAYFALLYRSSGQQDICIGTPVANRHRAELEGLIGFFVNTLVLRLRLEDCAPASELTFRQLLHYVRKVSLEAYAHQQLPFDVLVEELRPERNASYSPLFQTMFVLQNTPLQEIKLPGLTFEQIELHTGDAKFDLIMALAQDKGALFGVLEYSLDLFEASSMRRLIGHFQTLLESALTNPDQPLSDLPLMTPAEWQEIVVGWNQTYADYPRHLCLQHAFQACAARFPSMTAVVYQDKSLTYHELESRSNQLAHLLQQSGIGPDIPVGIYMERSLDLIIAILGVLKAGGAYVPLDPLYPPQRLSLMLDDILLAVKNSARAGDITPVLITQSSLRDSLPAPSNANLALRVIYGDALALPDEPADTPPASYRETGSPTDLAYILYTSGSTGTPKGVCVQHQGVINLLADFERRAPLAAGDRCSWWTSLNFDVSVYEIFTPLLIGATLCIVPEDIRAEGQKFFDWMQANQINSAYLPPFMVGEYKEWLAQASQRSGAHSCHLRRLLVGVEPIHEQLLAEINRYIPELIILNGYGPTEATVCCTLYQLDPQRAQNRNTPIGKPTANTQIYILDDHLKPLPVGVAGELYVGGDGLARGYLNRPELTAERFIPNPFAPTLSPRLYKTGDIVRYLADGNIEFIGRADFQVKLHGFRIELGEIEAVLSQHPAVRKSVALVWQPGDTQSKRLVAYVAAPASANLSARELREFLKTRLPDYMLPSAFVILENLPVTPNGKIDRRALPAPDAAQFVQARREFIEPRNPVEQQLVEIWRGLLGAASISIDDNFFELGGHSLLATQMNTRLRERFQVDVPLRDFFNEPTIEYLARRILNERPPSEGMAPLPTIQPRLAAGLALDAPAPLSYAQQRMWLLHQLDPQDAAYNIPLAVHLRGELDHEALQYSLAALVARHETLRTTFRAEDGIPYQVIQPAEAYTPGASALNRAAQLAYQDLSLLCEAERAEQCQSILVQEATRPFDLQAGPLLRSLLLRLAPDEHILLLVMHHIISDGWSMGILLEEMGALYQARLNQRAAPSAGDSPEPVLPPLSIQYADYALWQRQALSGESLQRLQEYWVKQLSGANTSLELPYDHPRPSMQTSHGAHLSFHLDREVLDGLNAIGQQANATLFITLLAAFQTLLYRYSGQSDICIGTPTANRSHKEVENLVGCFINTLVLRADFSQPKLSFREALSQVRATALEGYAHQEFPFEKLVEALQPERNMTRTPLFQVMFLLQNAPLKPVHLPGLTLQPTQIETGISTFDLTLALAEEQNGLSGGFEYNTDLFEAATIQRMAAHFATLLRGILANPDQPISQLPLMSPEELRQVQAFSQGERIPCASHLLMHHLFEAQAAQNPQRIAVVLPGSGAQSSQEMTYQELNLRANRVAHRLRNLGVRRDLPPVALFVERSFDMLAGLLGILKAGGAYLPLDPTYPAGRLDFILKDAAVELVLTQTKLKHLLPPGKFAIVCLDDASEIYSEAGAPTHITQESLGETVPDDALFEDLSAASLVDRIAYVIYTSGSTGEPKGVMVPHRAVVNHNLAAVDCFHLTPQDRVLQFMSISFDAAIEEIFPTWAAGATLVLRPRGELPTGEELNHLIASQSLTVLDLPTAYWHEWVYELALSSARLPASLRLVIIGGEKASAERVVAWQHVVGSANITLLNTYGPTEGTIIDTLFAIPAGAPAWNASKDLPIGRPIRNVDAYILDHQLQLLPFGVAGELHLGGQAVASGYLNRPELTQQRFIPDPFNQLDPNARLYKTGDRARLLSDGNIEFLGRQDDQVKIRGYRVELGEIEAEAMQFPGVRQAAVITWGAGEASPAGSHLRLVAFLVWETQTPDPEGLHRFLKSRLPAYMLPSHYFAAETLPMTASGKIDRKRLASQLTQSSFEEAASTDQAPLASSDSVKAQVEARLADIWLKVLGLERLKSGNSIDRHQNFFELGGDSILAIQVIARAAQAGMHLTPRQFFEHPTLAGLAAVVSSQEIRQEMPEEEVSLTASADADSRIPLTPIQQWFFEQEFPELNHWNQALLLEVAQPLDRQLLEQAVAILVDRHTALKMRFRRDEGAWYAVQTTDLAESPVVWTDLAQSSASAVPLSATLVSNLVTNEAERLQTSLEVQKGPLFRIAYMHLGAGERHRLMIVAHHLVMDGISWRILLEDLQTIYIGLSQGMNSQQIIHSLPRKTASYAQWARRLANHAQSLSIAETGYWETFSRQVASRLSIGISLPTDFQLGPNDVASTDHVISTLGAAETEALLHQAPAAYRTDPQDILLTALTRAIGDWTGIPQLYLELEGHGREDIFENLDVSRTVGWFTTIYPVLLNLQGLAWPDKALLAVKEYLRRIPRRGFGFGLLRYLPQGERTGQVAAQIRRNILPPPVSFNYLGQLDVGLHTQGVFKPAQEGRGADRGPGNPRGYLFEITAGVFEGCLQVHWSYSRNLHRRDTVETLARKTLTAAREIIQHCSSRQIAGYTSSDFELSGLDQSKLEKLLSRMGKPAPHASQEGE